MALLDDVGPFAKYWGSAVAAWNDPALPVGGGSKVQFVWQSIQQDYLSRGETLPPGSFQQVNTLLSASARVNRAMLQLGKDTLAVNRTGIDRAVTADHIAPDINTRPPDQLPAGPNYNVRFRADLTVGGMGFTQWLTWKPGANLPATIQGLQESLGIVAQGFTEPNASFPVDELSLTGDVVITSY
jgi:hypothetical protein